VAVLAVQQIRRMRGGAQGQLMLGADGHIYVVKFQNNPQHMRVLANEFLATRLTGLMGDGNGGRLAELELRMDRHEQNWQRAKGFLAALSVIFAVIEVTVETWHRH
jgi:hypothetical protein